MHGRFAIIGTSLGALVVAERLSAAGHDVWLFGRPELAGGEWRGLVCDGIVFDLGAFALGHRGDRAAHAPSGGRAHANDATIERDESATSWIEALGVSLEDLPTPILHLGDGSQIADPLMGGALWGLGALPPAVRHLIARDVRVLVAPPEPDVRSAHTLRDVLLRHFGATLVDAVFEPWVRAQVGVSSETLAPEAHRALGIALHRPEAVLAALDGRAVPRQGAALRRPTSGVMHTVVQRVLDVLATRPRVRWVSDVIERLEARGAGLVVHLEHTVLSFDGWCGASSVDRLLPLLGVSVPAVTPLNAHASSTVVCATVLGDSTGVPLHVALDETLPLRASAQPVRGDGRVPVTIDWATRANATDVAASVATREALLRLGIATQETDIDIHRVRRIQWSALRPTPDVVRARGESRARLAEVAVGAVLLGAAAGETAVSVDEDICLGLAGAARLLEVIDARGHARRTSDSPVVPSVAVRSREPRVSVLLTLTSASGEVGRALHAVLAQGLAEIEVVAVPIGETARARDAAARFAAQHPELPLSVLPVVEGLSPVEAMRRAVAHARADLLTTVGSEDALVPSALTDAVALLDEQPLLDAVIGDRLIPDGRRTVLKRVAAVRGLDGAGDPHAGVWRRALWDRVDGWRNGALDPARDFWVAASLAGAQGLALGAPFVLTPDATDRASAVLLGQDLDARAEIVVARAQGFGAVTVAIAGALRAGLPVATLIDAEAPAPILADGLRAWGDVAGIPGPLSSVARAWDAARGYAATPTLTAR
ncbi:MAG: hypothetical protein MUF00_01150 [Gemmatimonadaceae bacterium]|jgi:hypothetical protein|nr:hypothetical protein [Gemmatimonadaceae bacterium]